MNEIDKSEAADAKRLRWLLAGNGYFMEENGLCCNDDSEQEQDFARHCIDTAMKYLKTLD